MSSLRGPSAEQKTRGGPRQPEYDTAQSPPGRHSERSGAMAIPALTTGESS
jgi:hypothetical protein